MSPERKPVVSIGKEVVVIKRSGQSQPILAGILGMDLDGAGQPETVWLDRIVHRLSEDSFEGWHVSGAVTTVLRRQAPAKAA